MPKLRVLSGKEMCKILTEHGFKEVRRKGSHIIMQKTQGPSTITVPVPDQSELKTGTQMGIIRQTGLPRSLFETE
jgi:predicted RNA binding protein YcfA (HicA-like mRNA interferase family)